ncbi:NitT/TauT family transport system ATP-binding protein [Nitrobacteraceae bacterium AZCC 2161]
MNRVNVAMHDVNIPAVTSLASKSGALVVVDDVRIRFGEIDAAGPISFSVASGEFVSLLGPSGCGKSSLLRAIAGLVPIASGSLTIAGQPSGVAAAMQVGLMFQKPLLQNIVLPAEIALRSPGTVGRSERIQALNLLQLVGLSDFADTYPHQLSGGMQQRVALARTLMSAPDILLLDEPFGALDEFTRETLNEQLLSIWHSGATRIKAIIMVTHSIPEAVAMSDSIIVLGARPARLLDVITVRLPHPRDPADTEFARTLGATRTAAKPS